ncbi:MAG TPA: hypothetical protein VNM22_19450 [Candidatus Limnocylindrales bacterium]|nr:hypothetical protein [Candidatus Limnocylindrales bacterium]
MPKRVKSAIVDVEDLYEGMEILCRPCGFTGYLTLKEDSGEYFIGIKAFLEIGRALLRCPACGAENLLTYCDGKKGLYRGCKNFILGGGTCQECEQS